MSDADRRNGTRDGKDKKLTPNEFRRLQVQFVLQAMLSAKREGENQILPPAVVSKLLGHSSTGTTASYVNSRRCPVGSPPASCFEIPGVQAVADSERTAAEITSPFTRVHEEMNRAEALFAHHGALRAQLEGE